MEHNIRDQFIFKIAVPEANETNTEKFLQMLYKERAVLKDALDDETLNVPKVEWCSPSDLEYNSRTGKLKIIIDRRL